MASFLYNSFLEDIANGNVDCNTDTFKMLLCTSSYTPNKDHNRRDDITNEVAAGGGYTAGGTAVTITAAVDNANDRLDISLSNPSWSTATISAAYGVVYKVRGGASSADELVCLVDFGGTIVSTGGTFTVTQTTPFRITN